MKMNVGYLILLLSALLAWLEISPVESRNWKHKRRSRKFLLGADGSATGGPEGGFPRPLDDEDNNIGFVDNSVTPIMGPYRRTKVRAARHYYPPTPAVKADACRLAQELLQYDVPPHELPHWVCLAHHGTHFNRTYTIRRPKSPCTTRHGIFLIDDRLYCYNEDRKQIDERCERSPQRYLNNNRCNMKCADLRDEDIRDDIRCARQARMDYGFDYFRPWLKRCIYNPHLSEYLADCDLRRPEDLRQPKAESLIADKCLDPDGFPIEHVDCSEFNIIT